MYPAPNSTSVIGFFSYANSITNDVFGVFLLGLLFVILLITFKSYEMEKALITSLFITTVVGLLFGVAGIVSPTLAMILMGITGISVVFLIFRTNQSNA